MGTALRNSFATTDSTAAVAFLGYTLGMNLLKSVRLAHKYFGVFIAPAVLFFAFSGALQTFSLHESSKGSDYTPPHWIVVLSRIHKDQTPVVPPARPKPAPDAAKPHAPAPVANAPAPAPAVPPMRKHNPWPLKFFFLLVSIGLLVSTLTGLTMAYKYAGNKLAVTLTLVAGIVIPLVMLVI